MKENYKVKKVNSANKFYLFAGIISIILLIFLEIISIRWIILNHDDKWLIILLQIPALLCLAMSTTIKDYKQRRQFNLYLGELHKVDIRHIKDNFKIVEINESYVLFVEKPDEYLYDIWKIFNDNNLYRLYTQF